MKFVNILLQMEANPVKSASSPLLFSGYNELETGLLSSGREKKTSGIQGTCELARVSFGTPVTWQACHLARL